MIGSTFTMFNTWTKNDELGEIYKLLFGAIGLTATLAGLSLKACSTTQDESKKKVFCGAGERLFHATIMFSVATGVVYGCRSDSDFLPEVPYLSKVLLGALWLSSHIFFYYGLIYVLISIIILHRTLFPGADDNAPLKAIFSGGKVQDEDRKAEQLSRVSQGDSADLPVPSDNSSTEGREKKEITE